MRTTRQPGGAGRPLSRRAFLAHVAVWAGGGLLAAPLATARAAAKPNIILLTADSLRADHVGAYGYARPTTPHLDRLAADGVLFEYAFAPTSMTGPSLASLYTGKHPREHFMQLRNGKARYRNTDVMLPELLKAHGYQTAAFVSNRVLERTRSQMDRGFAHYDDALPSKREGHGEIVARRNAAETTAAVLQWLKARARPPFFLWVHYIEPHGPYAPPPPYATMFVNDALYRAEPRLLELSPEQLAGKGAAREARVQGPRVTPRVITYLDAERDAEGRVLRYNPRVADHIARYDGEIRYLDEAIGQVLQAVRTQGLYETSWLLFSSDHGESMGEGGFYFEHGRRVTLELIRVPLLVKPPDKAMPRRVSTQVSSIDLMPTLLEAVEIERPRGLSGHSILPLLRGERPNGPRRIFSEIGSQYSLTDDHYQLLVGYDLPTFRERAAKEISKPLALQFGAIPISLFSYRSDHVGEKDLVGSERTAAETRFREFRSFLQGYFQRAAQARRVPRPPVRDSAQTREILKQLGY